LSKKATKENHFQTGSAERPAGRLLAIDLGQKRVGLAISDELQMTARPLEPLPRTNWKKLLSDIARVVQSFDAGALVIGLPLRLDGSEGEAALEARRLARNFQLSLGLRIYLQDERLTSREAEEMLRSQGANDFELRASVDSEAAAIILRDFIAQQQGGVSLIPREVN
jgi:putative Holliday junction resolvase